METEEMIYYKGRLIPLRSDHPDISKAYKAREEIDLWQNETEDDIPQNPVTLEQKSNTLLINERRDAVGVIPNRGLSTGSTLK